MDREELTYQEWSGHQEPVVSYAQFYHLDDAITVNQLMDFIISGRETQWVVSIDGSTRTTYSDFVEAFADYSTHEFAKVAALLLYTRLGSSVIFFLKVKSNGS